jgi:hypothetical protein
MNDYEKTIKDLQDRVKSLEDRLTPCDGAVAKPVKWQPKGGYLQIDCGGDVVSVNSFSHQKEFGTKRITKEQAERACIDIRRFNRLLALRDELCGDEDVYWGDDYIEKYNVYFSHERGCWYVSTDIFCESITPYFTTKEAAQKACDMLNSGEVEL